MASSVRLPLIVSAAYHLNEVRLEPADAQPEEKHRVCPLLNMENNTPLKMSSVRSFLSSLSRSVSECINSSPLY